VASEEATLRFCPDKLEEQIDSYWNCVESASGNFLAAKERLDKWPAQKIKIEDLATACGCQIKAPGWSSCRDLDIWFLVTWGLVAVLCCGWAIVEESITVLFLVMVLSVCLYSYDCGCPDYPIDADHVAAHAEGTACTEDLQDSVDEYWTCMDAVYDDDHDAYPNWPAMKIRLKTHAEACGCGGAAVAFPSFGLAVAAAIIHGQ
jgi:hypothetical protein